MKHSVHARTCIATVLALAGTLMFASLMSGCDGSGSDTPTPVESGGKAVLLRLQYGRLVDICAYRRVDPALPDRRDAMNRTQQLHARRRLDAVARSWLRRCRPRARNRRQLSRTYLRLPGLRPAARRTPLARWCETHHLVQSSTSGVVAELVWQLP